MHAILSNMVPRANEATSAPEVHADVFYYGGTMSAPTLSALVVPFTASDTPAQIGAAILSAVDTESARLGIGTADAVLAPSFVRLR